MAIFNVHGNTFGATSTTYGGSKNVWHEVSGCYPVGGTIDLSSYTAGTVIPAGSMIYLNQSTHVATVVLASDTSALANVNGLLYNDIYVGADAKGTNGAATATVVYAGELYADRCAETIPSTVFANLPQIVAIREA